MASENTGSNRAIRPYSPLIIAITWWQRQHTFNWTNKSCHKMRCFDICYKTVTNLLKKPKLFWKMCFSLSAHKVHCNYWMKHIYFTSFASHKINVVSRNVAKISLMHVCSYHWHFFCSYQGLCTSGHWYQRRILNAQAPTDPPSFRLESRLGSGEGRGGWDVALKPPLNTKLKVQVLDSKTLTWSEVV